MFREMFGNDLVTGLDFLRDRWYARARARGSVAGCRAAFSFVLGSR